MQKIILSVALLLVAFRYVHSKCDMMKDFKAEFEDIKKWGEEQCKKRGGKDLEPKDMEAAKECYDQHIKPVLTSDNAKKVEAFVDKKIFCERTLKVCHDKDVQKAIQSDATKDIGIPTGMKLKQEIEKDPECNPFKKNFQGYNECVKGKCAK